MMQAWLDGLKSGAEVVPLHGKGLNEDKRTRSVMHIGKAIVVCAFAGVIATGQAWADCQPELVVTDNNRPGWKLTVQWPKIEKRQFRLFDPNAAIDFQCELSHWSSTSSAEKLGVGCVTASDDAFLVLLPSPEHSPIPIQRRP